MRETSNWHKKLTRRLRDQWPSDTKITPSMLCEIELALTLHHQLIPDAPVESLWVLLTGYPFPALRELNWTKEQWLMLGTARHLLPYYRSPFPWNRALTLYFSLDEYLRGYQLADQMVVVRDVTLCADRFDFYLDVLSLPPKYRKQKIQWASPGSYEFASGKRLASVVIPEDMNFSEAVSSHNLYRRDSNPPLRVRWNDLLDVARVMDERLIEAGYGDAAYWEDRMQQVQLELFDEKHTEMRKAAELQVDGLLNLIGMVSSGKTTLITVLSVWAVQHGLHVTLIVGDVMSALDRAQLFTRLGLDAAPILGASNRARHTNRLHRALNAENPHLMFNHHHKGFDWLSTSCGLDGLCDRPSVSDITNRPCQSLLKTGITSAEEDTNEKELFACSLFSHCAFHQAQRDLVTANIWIATPASLVYTRVAPQINREQLRFAELIYMRSDLVIVDEADQVQIQLDNIFSPNQTLTGRGYSAWFNRLSQQVLPRLNLEGRAQLAEEAVEAWCSAHEMALMAVNRVYAMLLQEPVLRHEIEQDYFTAWMILEKLAFQLSGAPADKRHDHPEYRHLMDAFEQFIGDPLGEREDFPLATLAQQSVTHSDKLRTQQKIAAWFGNQLGTTIDDEHELRRYSVLLEFALVVGILSDRLDHLLRDWKHAELALQLDGASSIIFHRPPDDYTPVIPVSPMGNVLAFQYVRSSDNGDTGDLRFFRCLGVGRWLLLHLHDLFVGDGIAGPHVILFSGTSWAGKSPSCHIQLPVAGVLRAPEAEVHAITMESEFHFSPVYDDRGLPIRVSGKRGQDRITALYQILHHHSRRTGVRQNAPSLLEQERDLLPPDRKRILLLVGSYVEATQAREYLERIRPDWRGQILNLVSDDDEFESDWYDDTATLQRGLVHQFAETGAWLLIAPLLAIERGHNILNEQNQAAIGSVYFLIRPHPRPDDIGFAIQSINRWAVEEYTNIRGSDTVPAHSLDVLETGKAFREAAFKRWRYLLHLPMIYGTLPPNEREAITWSQLVTIWQVIGRLIRGGSSARVFFCDAAFGPSHQHDNVERDNSSLLINIRQVLAPYFDRANTSLPIQDKILVETLYGPFYQAISRMKGISEHAL